MDDDGGFHYVGPIKELSSKPVRVIIENRRVAIFHHANNFYAIDANCFHAAGKLEKCKDIEDIMGEPCIRCPLHSRVISLETGHNFYHQVKVENAKKRRKLPDKDEKDGGKCTIVPLGWRSLGIKQRIHHVKVVEGNLYIKLNLEDFPPGQVESDKYCTRY